MKRGWVRAGERISLIIFLKLVGKRKGPAGGG